MGDTMKDGTLPELRLAKGGPSDKDIINKIKDNPIEETVKKLAANGWSFNHAHHHKHSWSDQSGEAFEFLNITLIKH